MEIYVAGPIYTYKYQSSYGTKISIPHNMGGNNVAIIPIYGVRSFFKLFYDNQDTEYESRNIEIGASGPIFTHKISTALW